MTGALGDSIDGAGTGPGAAPSAASPSAASPRPASGSGAAGGVLDRVAAVDALVDRWFEHVRGNPVADGAARAISGLGDHGLMWAATTVWRLRRRGPARARAVRALTIAGLESSLVNATIKGVVGRDRPDDSDLELSPGGIPVRVPSSSSFPSGHTLAAFCAATVMREPGNPVGNAFLFGAAGLVGISRLHLRAHHASDVVGGALIGTVLGLLGRRLLAPPP